MEEGAVVSGEDSEEDPGEDSGEEYRGSPHLK